MDKRVKSFGHAWEGIIWILKEHPNFIIHILLAFLAIAFALVLQFNRIELIILILTILVVFIAEMVNTAIEEVTNLITIKWAKHAKIAKDVSAGMVLIAAISSIIIGIILFLPKIL